MACIKGCCCIFVIGCTIVSCLESMGYMSLVSFSLFCSLLRSFPSLLASLAGALSPLSLSYSYFRFLQDLMLKPVSLSCSHTFCGECIAEWFGKSDGTVNYACILMVSALQLVPVNVCFLFLFALYSLHLSASLSLLLPS